MCKIIAIANQKGGQSKSTTAVNLAIGLARHGEKVAVIDADPQGSATASLGFVEPDELEITLATILGHIINEEAFDPKAGILQHPEGIDIVPSNIELSGLEVAMMNIISREYLMKEYVDMISRDYSYIIIDCSPSLGMMTINALVAATSVLIPVTAQFLPVKGLQMLLHTVTMVQRRLNRQLTVEGILLSMVDMRSNYSRDIISKVREGYADTIGVFETYIPMSVKASETSAEGISIFSHCPHSKVAQAYEALTQEVLAK
ncbi:MAG: ParA family protein [Blautia sp.]|nr:ParA family protein [Blautia sp.]